tara:strand:+ start:509 stop:994 length:486 start_codon:yes stop_codon:yes gene_type:complete
MAQWYAWSDTYNKCGGSGGYIELTRLEIVPLPFYYEFVVNVPHAATIGHHIFDFLIDGVRPPEGSVDLYQSPDHKGIDSHVWDGDNTTIAAWINPQSAGDVFMTVALNQPERPKSFTIVYARPLYAPGWIIKENGVAIITETENRGGEYEPQPVRYDYVLP